MADTALSSPGLGSGLDVRGLVSQLMAVERQPLAALDKKEASYQAKLSALGVLKGALSSFQTAGQALNTTEKFSPTKASVADSTLLSATSSATAVAGTYALEVESLAKSQKLMSTGYAATTSTVGTGTITIDFGTYSSDVPPTFTANADKPQKSIVIGDEHKTLAGVRDAINAANAGVTASIINDGSTNGNRLVLTSTASGARNAMKISVAEGGVAGLAQLAYDPTSGGTANLSQTVGAKDAVIKVDNVTITKQSNTITDAIQGITLNLTDEKPGTTTKLTVTRDTASVQTAIQNFVKAYNDVNKNLKDSMAYDATTGKAAVLNGDSTARAIQTQIRNTLAKPVTGAPTGLSSLADIGITFQKDGSLAIDSDKLSAALNNPFKDVSKLFAKSTGVEGYGSQIEILLGRITSPVGTLASHTNSINSSIKDIGKQRAALNERLEMTEKRYRAQFTALDTAVASMSKTSMFLQQQISSLNNQSN